MKLLMILSSLLSFDAFSSGSTHAGHASPTDLIPAFINFTILFVVLFKLLKKPVSEFFKTKHAEIKSLVEAASIKAQDAQKMLEEQKKKSANLQSELKELESDSNKLIEDFQATYSNDVQERIVRLKEDTVAKISAEKKAGFDDLNKELLNEVVSQAKNQIRADKTLNKEASDRILEGIR